jgi:hypothetical protein
LDAKQGESRLAFLGFRRFDVVSNAMRREIKGGGKGLAAEH